MLLKKSKITFAFKKNLKNKHKLHSTLSIWKSRPSLWFGSSLIFKDEEK